MNIIKKFCPKISCKKKSIIEIIPNRKIKLIDTIFQTNIIKKVHNKEQEQMLMCTHCGGKIVKPIIPSKYIIYCVDCFRPLDLPETYYTS